MQQSDWKTKAIIHGWWWCSSAIQYCEPQHTYIHHGCRHLISSPHPPLLGWLLLCSSALCLRIQLTVNGGAQFQLQTIS